MHTARRRIVIFALALGVPAAVVDPGVADASSCAPGVVVEGRLLFGYGNVARAHLPRAVKERRAIKPACNYADEDEPDRAIRVLTLDGVPPEIAVVRPGQSASLYLAEGSLVVSSAHPLHRAVYRRTSPRSGRRRACRREPRALRGTLTDDSPIRESALTLRSGSRRIVIRADARTRLTNRPPYETLNPGQRLAVRTSRCGARRVADMIAFDGPTVSPERYEPDTGGVIDLDVRWLVAVAFVSVIVVLLLAARRLGRDPS